VGRLAVAILLVGAVVAAVVLAVQEDMSRDLGRNEVAAFRNVRAINMAQLHFREGDKTGKPHYADSLEELGRCGLIDAALASGTKEGFTYRIIHADELTYSADARPIEPGVTGGGWIFIDESGINRIDRKGVATSLSTPTGG
jgi:hypothetical protein